jgi:hypothetical protein
LHPIPDEETIARAYNEKVLSKFTALVDATETEVQSRHGLHPIPDEETIARAYNEKVLSGCLRSAVRNLMKRDQGGILQLDDACTKTGQPVLEVLPPDLQDPNCRALWGRPQTSPHQDHGQRGQGCCLPLLRRRRAQRHLCRRPAELAPALWRQVQVPQGLAGRPHRMACQRAPAMGHILRAHGLPPGCLGEESWREASPHRRGLPAPDGQVPTQGRWPGIEGTIHAMRQATAAPPIPPAPPNQPVPLEPPCWTDPMDLPPEPDGTQPADPSGALIVNAINGFNELGRQAMLWTVWHR